MTGDTEPDSAIRRSVVVTGGSHGIGRAVVEEFAAHGYTVVSLDRTPPEAPPRPDVVHVPGDVTVGADNERAVAAALARCGRLDVFVGNAGVHDGGVRLRDRPGEELAAIARRVLEIDVVGYLLGAHAAAEPLAESGGSMVFTLSDASFVVRGNGSGIAYAAAKHAALGLVRHLAADLAPRVRVNAVAPGGVITGLRAVTAGEGTTEVFDDAAGIADAIRRLNPLGVVLAPEQLAPIYRFLAESGAGMTGEVIRPDGGLGVR
ncbi:MAG TPA: SDR family oxidoreductase [Actinospica sp.]|nr:SDR family oxidoreductase [Actinospica sp.]